MTVMTYSRLAPYRRLADNLEAATNRRDEIGADAIRDLLPELRDAVDAINAAIHEADELLFRGLRDEALGFHDPDLFIIAARINLQNHLNWPSIQVWLADYDVAELPYIDTCAISMMETAQRELESFSRRIDRLRRMALEHAPISQKIEVLRSMRYHDPTKQVWVTNITSHEDARLVELRAAIQRALQNADFDMLVKLHVELVNPDWEAKIPSELVVASRGADVAVTLRNITLRAESLAQDIETRHAASNEFTHLHCEELVDLRQRLEECASVAKECMSQLQDCPMVLSIVTKQGLHSVIEKIYLRLALAFEWILVCENLHRTRATFAIECCQLEYLCDHMPDKKSESKWITDVRRSEAEVQRCCQELDDLVFRELLQERLRKATGSIKSREDLRLRFVIISAVAGVLLLGSITGFFGWMYWIKTEHYNAVALLQAAVNDAQLGGYLDRPEEVVLYAGSYPTDPTVTKLVREFDEGVVAEKSRRQEFDSLIVTHKESMDSVSIAVQDRENSVADLSRLQSWPECWVESCSFLADARDVGGLPNKRSDDSEINLPLSARRRFEKEENELAEQESKSKQAELAFEKMAVESFERLRNEIQKRVPNSADNDAQTVATELLGELRSLRRDAMSEIGNGLPLDLAHKTRVPLDTVNSLEPLEKKLSVMAKGAR